MPDSQHLKFLRKVPLFKSLSESHTRKLADRMRERNFKAGELIVEQGKLGIGLFVIIEGEVKINRVQEDGSKRQIDELEALDFFGELSLLDDAPRVAEAIADTDVRCLVLLKLDFLEELEHEPHMAIEMLKELAHRFRRIVSNL
jgi:CRP/FNR family transcriptional regulator, cyclic AMP receptor protein